MSKKGVYYGVRPVQGGFGIHVFVYHADGTTTRMKEIERERAVAKFKPAHVHNWCPTDSFLIDRCSVCGEERA
jgi:hypothetical protein